jgi:hypothetical protein
MRSVISSSTPCGDDKSIRENERRESESINQSINHHERRLASPPPRLAAVACVLERSM